MKRCPEEVLGISIFHNSPCIHHSHLVAHVGYEPQVVGDEEY